jgi:hypothetical protein
MQLMTKELEKKLPPLYSQEKVEDPMCLVKFFCPWNNWTWYAYEYDPKDHLFFGYVQGIENEVGYFSLEEMESVTGPMGLKIERDLHWEPQRLSQIKVKETQR